MVPCMRRHCGRPGCSALATVTFSFDAAQCVVWLNPISDGAPRAGDLCTRHADAMAPPKGWERIDRRVVEPTGNEPLHNVPIADTAESALSPAPERPRTPASPAPHIATAATSEVLSVPVPPPVTVGDDLLPHRPAPKRKRRKRWDEVPSLFGEATSSTPEPPMPAAPDVLHDGAPQARTDAQPEAPPDAQPEVQRDAQREVQPEYEHDGEPSTADADVSWLPRNATNEDLDRVLDAATPMLARAFRNARPLEVDATAGDPAPASPDGDG